MLSKEILNDITLDELKGIAEKWHEIDEICDASPDGYKQFAVTQDVDGFTDRYIDGATFSMWITTDNENGKTMFSVDIILYKEDCEIAETNIRELEEFINGMEG